MPCRLTPQQLKQNLHLTRFPGNLHALSSLRGCVSDTSVLPCPTFKTLFSLFCGLAIFTLLPCLKLPTLKGSGNSVSGTRRSQQVALGTGGGVWEVGLGRLGKAWEVSVSPGQRRQGAAPHRTGSGRPKIWVLADLGLVRPFLDCRRLLSQDPPGPSLLCEQLCSSCC